MRLIGKGLHVLAHACSHLSAVEETGLVEAQPAQQGQAPAVETPTPAGAEQLNQLRHKVQVLYDEVRQARDIPSLSQSFAYSRVLGMLDNLIDGPGEGGSMSW